MRSEGAIVVGSKNFTEQLILGEIVAQTIERQTGLPVKRQLNLGGTLICDRALTAGDIDVYVEYTGTALTAIFGRPIIEIRRPCWDELQLYADSGRTLLAARLEIRSRSSFAAPCEGENLHTIDDAARHAEWRLWLRVLERSDGRPGEAYGLRFRSPPQVMDLTLSYRARVGQSISLPATRRRG
jgi:glycine betaine/choline ABC-type transport system substrate-binding protein